MQINPGDTVRWRTDTATVDAIEANGKLRVTGKVAGLGPFEQHWYPEGVEIVERATLEEARQAEQLAIDTSDPNAAEEDRPRLGGQNGKILARLQQGPATSVELKEITHRFGGRIGDIRNAGYTVESTALGGGVWRYELK